MTRSIKKVIITMVLIAVLGIPFSGFASNSAAININSATQIELQNINGIGPKMAEKIISYREQHGKFAEVADLCNVQGIGEKSLQKIATQICVK